METRRRRTRGTAVLMVVLVAILGLSATSGAADGPSVAIGIDFTTPIAATPRTSMGFTATTFGVDGGTVVKTPADATTLGRLGAGAVRIHLRATADGSATTGASGGAQEVPAVDWLAAYHRMGLEPTVVVDLDQAGALAVLRYVRTTAYRVHRYVLGNEMDGNSRSKVSPDEYVRRFRAIAAAMRAVDPALQIGGPAPAYFEGLTRQLVDGLVRAPVAERASFIDYHAYGAGEKEQATIDSAWRYAGQLDRLRTMIDDPAVGLQVGEFNLNWSDEPKNNTHFQSVWVAAALGTILSRGATAFQYGDKNNAMGLVAGGAPKAGYWGMAAFTGAGLFRAFGTMMVASTSSDDAVRVFASTGGKNVVIVNTGPAVSAALSLRGFDGGSATVWRDDAVGPELVGRSDVGSRVVVALPAMSVTVMVLDGR